VVKRVVVLGGGAAAQAFVAALRRLDGEASITMVEKELVGGECTYWACMPSKGLLRAPETVAAARRAPGAAEAVTGELALDRIFWWRDQIVDNWDDSGMVEWLTEREIGLVRAQGRVVEPGLVEAAGERLAYDALVVATGSRPAAPPIDGLEGSGYWTSREATSAREVPGSLIVLGGGPVGCELGQLYARLGTRVTIVHNSEHLLPRDDADAGLLVQRFLEEDGIEVRLCTVTTCVAGAGRFRLETEAGPPVEGERLLVVTGRQPNVEGLEPLGLTISKRGVEVDDRLRAADGVWALGDVTGIANFTHVGKYHGRVAALNVAGGDARADHRAIPAVTFTDPQVASVGRLAGEGLVTSTRAIERTSRTSTYERPKRSGFVKLVADPERGVLVGAVAVGPEAGEWLGQLTLAVRAEVPIDVLRDTIQPYPTFSEAIAFAARDLPL
jgi:pyruvate/2-oxoglutarate dehydrogenase complex dihydrolipoamide dehydrogenase (E3) component